MFSFLILQIFNFIKRYLSYFSKISGGTESHRDVLIGIFFLGICYVSAVDFSLMHYPHLFQPL